MPLTDKEKNQLLIDALAEVRKLEKQVADLTKERDEWKKRAAQHGCNVVEGDHECG